MEPIARAGASHDTEAMDFVPPARHLLRARDLADARYVDPLDVDELAGAAGLSRAHFSREFRRAFGESPHGLRSVGSFTTSFTRTYGRSPTAYRAEFPPASEYALIPTCVLRAYGRPQHRTFREDSRSVRA